MSVAEDDIEFFFLDSIFTEPSRPPTPESTITTYSRERIHDAPCVNNESEDWNSIDIKLVGAHPLWGHYLWNASRAAASYLDANIELCEGRSVLELGAGGGLPGIVAAKNGAQRVVLTDYPDTELVRNLEDNVTKNISATGRNRISVQGYIWGRSVKPLLNAIPSHNADAGFDLIILSDLICNHSQHDALLETCELALAPLSKPRPPEKTMGDSKPASTRINEISSVLVFYTHHRPHMAHRDMEFFARARERGWRCDEVLTRKYPPMFPHDPGEEEIRSTVHGWKLTRTL